MIIDFHTHIFPDTIAKRALDSLTNQSHLTPYLNGTLGSLKECMKNENVDISVVLPVMTSVKQFEKINQFSIEANKEENLIAFGGIHPECQELDSKIDFIKNSGIKGVKLHPDYQGGHFINDSMNIALIEKCIDADLSIVIHAGVDVGLPNPVHCPPHLACDMLKQIKTRFSNKRYKIILAHLGGMNQWNDVEKYLIGENVYFDLAYIPKVLDRMQTTKIIKNHGVNKILFGTDSPWISQKESINFVDSLDLTSKEKDMIFSENAKELLNI